MPVANQMNPLMIPSFEDISPTHGINLDERVAAEHFLGLTKTEARTLFDCNFCYYASDLMWMGWRAFEYYCEPAIDSMFSGALNSDVASQFLGIIRFRSSLCSREKQLIAHNRGIMKILNYLLTEAKEFSPYLKLRKRLLLIISDLNDSQ